MKEKLIKDIQDSYGIECQNYEPVSGGWMNEKWKVTSPQGVFLVKRFSRQRFSIEKLQQMERTLHVQVAMKDAGIPCSRILLTDGRTIRFLDDEHVYMVMEYAQGHIETWESITLKQMESLGWTAHQMRKVFDKVDPESILHYPAKITDFETQLREHFAYCLETQDTSREFAEALEMMRPIIENLSLEEYQLGVGHEDFAWDNMLFTDEEVAAILDFDRVQYGLTLHDIGRILMSYAFNGETLDLDKIEAFKRGYGEPLDVAAALKAVFYIEMPWWIRADMFAPLTGKILRFRDEVLWLAANWDLLEALVQPKAPAWKVYYGDGFFEHHGRSRAGHEILVNASVAWGDEVWHIPAVYTCTAGLVIDICVEVDPTRIRNYIERWGLLQEAAQNRSLQEQRLIMSENPLDPDFQCQVTVNGQQLMSKGYSGLYWIPVIPSEMNNPQARWVLDHYHLIPEYGWNFFRVHFPWASVKKPRIRNLKLMLKQNMISIPAGKISGVQNGSEISIQHPVTGDSYTLVVDAITHETLDTAHMPKDMEYPRRFVQMLYHWKEDFAVPQVQIRDGGQGDSPRKYKRESQVDGDDRIASSIGILGGADGPTVLTIAVRPQGQLQAACSAVRFEKCENVIWEVLFQVKTKEDLSILLIEE